MLLRLLHHLLPGRGKEGREREGGGHVRVVWEGWKKPVLSFRCEEEERGGGREGGREGGGEGGRGGSGLQRRKKEG
jgi:hypothetical protein